MQVPNKTNAFLRSIKPLIPEALRLRLRKFHQKIVFKKAIQNFRNHYSEIEKYPAIIPDLIYGWGNMGWSSVQDYTSGIISAMKETQGPVLECGSGLTTLIMGIIADDRGIEVFSLEHHTSWAKYVKAQLENFKINNAKVIQSSLKDYGQFYWYNIEVSQVPSNISLVICDGPPHDTEGGRYGLFPRMSSVFTKNAIILLDDYDRAEEQSIVSKWQTGFNLKVSRCGTNDVYAKIIFDGLL
jgi:hypothetical protein